MKKILAICMLMAMLCTTACTGDGEKPIIDETTVPEVTEAPEETTEASTEPEDTMYDDITDFKSIEAVVSVEREDVYLDEKGVGFKMIFKNGEDDICVYITAPRNYKNMPFPVVMHFPEIEFSCDTGNSYFTSYGCISVTISPRGAESTGLRDLGEDELSDVAFVMDILRNCRFVDHDKIFITGAGIGSVVAYKAARVYADEICGIATVNTISDFNALYKMGGNIETASKLYLGGTPDEVPDAYYESSVINYVADIKCPVLLISYPQHPIFTIEQSENLKAEILAAGGDCSLISLEGIKSDFSDRSAQLALDTFMDGEELK